MKKNKNLEISLFETLTDKSLEFSGEVVELTIDQFIENDLLKEIPFFSILYKSVKTIQGIREAFFAMKVYKFITEFAKIKQGEKDNFLNSITFDKKERIKVGQTLIMILDKIDEVDKTQLIATLFTAYIKSDITKSEFTQLCSIVEKIFIDDLLLFIKTNKYDDIPIEIQANLNSAGLMMPIVIDIKSMYDSSVIIDKKDNNMIVYVANKLGKKLKKVFFVDKSDS